MKARLKKRFHGVQCWLGWHGDYAVRQALCATTTDLVCTRCECVIAIPVVLNDVPPVYTSLSVGQDGMVKLTISDGRRELMKIKYSKPMAIQMGREFLIHAEKLGHIVHLNNTEKAVKAVPYRKPVEAASQQVEPPSAA